MVLSDGRIELVMLLDRSMLPEDGRISERISANQLGKNEVVIQLQMEPEPLVPPLKGSIATGVQQEHRCLNISDSGAQEGQPASAVLGQLDGAVPPNPFMGKK